MNYRLLFRILFLFPVPLLVFAGCVGTRYVEIGNELSIPMNPVRSVGVEVDKSILEDVPDCTVVLEPEADDGLEILRPIAEEVLTRHASQKFFRTVGTRERKRLSRDNALNLKYKRDQYDLARTADCATLLYSRVVGPGKTYLVVWSQVQIGLEIILVRVSDRKIMWRARHMADRSAGGLPLSPAGFVIDTYSSTSFSLDREIWVSMMEDTVRRILHSLPIYTQFRAVDH